MFIQILRRLYRSLLRRLLPAGMYYIGGSDTLPPPLSREEEAETLAALERGDAAAAHRLIEHNLRLVAHIVKKYYAQDIPTMGKYLDAILPMVYKGNYHAGSKWIKWVTKTFAKQSKKAKIWTGLQTYKSDASLKKLSAKELMGDADAAALGGAYGVILFRYGLFNYINFNEV